MASSQTYKDDRERIWTNQWSNTVASTLITLTFATPASGCAWVVKTVEYDTDLAGSLTYESPAGTTVNKVASTANSIVSRAYTADAMGVEFVGPSGAKDSGLVVKLSVTTTGNLNVIAVQEPVNSYNQGV